MRSEDFELICGGAADPIALLGITLIRGFTANEKFKLFMAGISFDYRGGGGSTLRSQAIGLPARLSFFDSGAKRSACAQGDTLKFIFPNSNGTSAMPTQTTPRPTPPAPRYGSVAS